MSYASWLQSLSEDRFARDKLASGKFIVIAKKLTASKKGSR
jgi:hypothetical protein